jgi:hypothetical protein
MTQTREQSGVLVVRAWVEGSLPDRLRARITQIGGLDDEQLETSAASVDHVLAVVRDWLESLLADSSPPAGTT